MKNKNSPLICCFVSVSMMLRVLIVGKSQRMEEKLHNREHNSPCKIFVEGIYFFHSQPIEIASIIMPLVSEALQLFLLHVHENVIQTVCRSKANKYLLANVCRFNISRRKRRRRQSEIEKESSSFIFLRWLAIRMNYLFNSSSGTDRRQLRGEPRKPMK